MHASRPWEGCRRQWVVGRGAHRLKAPLSMLSSPVGEGEVSVQKACEKASTHTHTHAHTHMHKKKEEIHREKNGQCTECTTAVFVFLTVERKKHDCRVLPCCTDNHNWDRGERDHQPW